MPTSLPLVPIFPSSAGVHAETPPSELAFGGYVDAENVIWRNGEFRTRDGLVTVGQNIAQRPVGVICYDTLSELGRLVIATTTGMWVMNPGTMQWTNITQALNPLTGSEVSLGVMRVFQSGTTIYTLLVNGKDKPKSWDNVAVNYVDLGGMPPSARCMIVCNNRVVMGNLLEESPQTVDRSNFLNPASGWGTDLVVLGDTPGPIVAMRELGNLQFSIYKSDAIYVGQALEGTAPFGYSLKAAFCSGPLSPLSVISVREGMHLYLALDGGIYQFDGVQPVSLGRHIQAYIQPRLDVDRAGRAFGAYDARTNTATFWYPRKGVADTDAAVMIDLDTGALWPLRWPSIPLSTALSTRVSSAATIASLPPIGQITMTLGELASHQVFGLMGGAGGQFYTDSAYSDNGTAIPFSLETGTSDLGDGSVFKVVTGSEHLYREVAGSQTVGAEIGVSNYGEDPAYDGLQTFDLVDGGPFELGHRTSGREVSLHVSGNATERLVWIGSRIAYAPAARR